MDKTVYFLKLGLLVFLRGNMTNLLDCSMPGLWLTEMSLNHLQAVVYDSETKKKKKKQWELL